jgi:hypothetical protein
MFKIEFVYLANTAVLCYSLTIICCCQVQDYIYWIISTENDHRHHHKFIKLKNDWEKKEKTCSAYQSSKIFATSVRVWCVALPWVRSNGPTDPLHISCICSIWKILHFYSSFSLNPSKSAFFNVLTLSLLPKNHMLFIVSKQCACSRRVHIEGHMNRFEFLLSWTIILITIVLGLFFVKKSYLLQNNLVLIFILWRSIRKTTIILGMKKLRLW